ncbi:MAG: hypothetical protein ACKO34_06925 [Vampirovibrionales bacterium]
MMISTRSSPFKQLLQSSHAQLLGQRLKRQLPLWLGGGLAVALLLWWRPWIGSPPLFSPTLTPDTTALLLLHSSRVMQLMQEQRHGDVCDVWFKPSLRKQPATEALKFRHLFLQSAYCADQYLGSIQQVKRNAIRLTRESQPYEHFKVVIPVERSKGNSTEVLEYVIDGFNFHLSGYYWLGESPFFYDCLKQTEG